MRLLYYVLLIFFPVVGVMFGMFLLCKPLQVIECQEKFYEMINWRIEPVSMEKELRHTRIMGIMLIITILLIMAYYFISGNI
ncbi:MAG: hypothetical protein ABIH74_01630 [Candidatus Omnitrophota bacterium]